MSNGCSRGHGIALTFDDGPNPPYTGRILDVLQDKGAPATFFLVGSGVEEHPEEVRREQAIGMAIGSHSYAHARDYPTIPEDKFAADLSQAERSISAITGSAPRLFRSPYGHTSGSMRRVLEATDYVSLGWDVDSRDWDRSMQTDDIVKNVLQHAHPGAIVLLHDGGAGGGDPDRSETIAALPQIIDGLRDHGYELETVPDLTGLPETANDVRRPACSPN